MRATLRLLSASLVLGLPAACGEKAIDWSAPENLLLREQSTKKNEGIQLDYVSLVDAPCQPVYDALVDVEHYPDFIPGIDRTQILGLSGNTKTVQIAQRVIGRQSNAKVEWKFDPAKKTIAFKTLSSDLNFNDGHYELESSPDGKRCLVRSTFLVKEAEEAVRSVPVGVLAAGTRDAFLTAARGVAQRAKNPPKA
jgi:hypothetical protein